MQFVLNKNYLDYESKALLYYLQEYNWFYKLGYNVTYPDNPIFDDILNKAKSNSLNDNDLNNIKNKLSQISSEEEYNKIYDSCELIILEINIILDQYKNIFIEMNKNFDFKLFKNYNIEITKYGPGGSYNPSDGTILIKWRNNNLNKSTLIHELFHIGIEESIIQKYNINHETKEYIVDMFVKSNFSKEFSDYYIQSINDQNVDVFIKEYINEKFNWNELDNLLKSKKLNL